MSDINIQNLDGDKDSPRLARVELLESVVRVNSLTQRIRTDVANLTRVSTGFQVDGVSTLTGNVSFGAAATVQSDLTVNGNFILGAAGAAGKVLASAGPGNPITWVDLPAAGDKFKGSSTSSVAIDATTPKNFVITTGLSFTAGQSVVVARDASNYISGTVTSYNPTTGALVVANQSQVGTGTYNSWTVNINGAKGDVGTSGTNGATWYNGAGAPSAGTGVNGDYYLNKTNGDYYQKSAGAWSLLGNLTGVAGAAGSVWYSGATAPSAGTGVNGDYYVNTTTSDYYTKTAGAWNQLGNLKGATGAAGSKWFTGAGAPAGATGSDGDYYLNTSNGDYYTKSSNTWGLVGNLKGVAGTNGTVWYNGSGAPAAGVGSNNDYYINTATGDYYQKQSGTWTLLGNLTGPAGSGGGGGGSSTVFGTTSRYQAVTTTGQGVTIISSASFKTGIAWSRTGTSMTFTDNNHGRSVGERAILRNVNVTGFDSLITAVTTNTFTVTCADTGATSGSAGAYSMGFTFAYNGAAGAYTGGTVTAPANWDCVLLAVRMHVAANNRAGTTFNLSVPKGNINGAGPHTGMDDISVPIQQVRQDGNSLAAVGATISTNTAVAGDYATYQWAALSSVAVGLHFTANF